MMLLETDSLTLPLFSAKAHMQKRGPMKRRKKTLIQKANERKKKADLRKEKKTNGKDQEALKERKPWWEA